jgi:hypothetical protein
MAINEHDDALHKEIYCEQREGDANETMVSFPARGVITSKFRDHDHRGTNFYDAIDAKASERHRTRDERGPRKNADPNDIPSKRVMLQSLPT